jgi:uncharacterized membrane protein YraQ (UPF0718 family)
MFTYLVYALAGIGLAVSFVRDRTKTRQALKKAWKSFENILPQFSAVLLLIGLALAVLSPETISMLLGEKSGAWGLLAASVLGSVTLIPGFVAFPLAAALLQNGAGYMQIAAFVSTLTMVGVVTMPLEMQTFGRKLTLLRNAAALVFSVLAALLIGAIL